MKAFKVKQIQELNNYKSQNSSMPTYNEDLKLDTQSNFDYDSTF